MKAFTERPEALAAYGGLHARDGRRFTVTAARGTKPGEAILTLAEVTDPRRRRGAEGHRALRHPRRAAGNRRRRVLPRRSRRPARRGRDGRVLGIVQAIHNYGAGDVIEIARPDGDSVLLPFTRETVPGIEIDQGRILVAVPEEVETGERGNVE